MTHQPPDQSTVRPGQIWADDDPRQHGRTIRVERIEHPGGGYPASSRIVLCTVLTLAGGRTPTWGRDRQVRIQVDRMRPGRTGYRLVQDAPTTPEEGS